MQKHLLYINLFAISSALALAACSDEVENAVTPDMPEVGEKTPIELSVGGVEKDALTRAVAVITNPENKELISLAEGTSIFMLMKSEYEAFSDSYAYFNYGGTQDPKYATTCGTVGEDNKVLFNNEASIVRTRYWDDAHARSSKLSIWAVACDGLQSLGGIGTNLDESKSIFNTANSKTAWGTTEIIATSLEWNVPNSGTTVTGQNADIIKNRDLLFSNNLANYSTSSSDANKDKRLRFDPATKSFGGGKLVFYHALSKITINFKIGEGFTGTGDFTFPAGKNVQLNHFNIWGQFSTVDGEFKEVNKPYGGNDGHASINSIYNTTGTTPNTTEGKPAYVLEALVLPSSSNDTKSVKGSRFISGNLDAMMEFSIDNNAYKISSDALYKALHVDSDLSKALVQNAVEKTDAGTYIPLEAGKNYIFTFVIGKTKIQNITATVAKWEEVEAEEVTPSNARITLNLEEREGDELKEITDKADGFSLYRSADDNMTGTINDDHTVYNWKSGYNTEGLTPSFVSAVGTSGSDGYVPAHWSTSWYWDNNLNFYHFRALCEAHGDAAKTAVTPITSATSGDCLELQSAETTASSSYKDICWGAPMKDVAGGNSTPDVTPLAWNYGPTKNGFDGKDDIDFTKAENASKHQIYKAIGPTEEQIKLILFHMMSDVTFKVYTTTGDDMVDLGDGTGTNVTSIELQNIYTQGNLYLGNGLVKGSQTEKVNYPFTAKPAPDNTTKIITWGNYGAIPQSLEGVALVITTADHNQYKVKLWDPDHPITATVSNNNLVNPYTPASGSNNKYQINAWYPGYKYTYNFKLTKTGITDLTATVVDWEDVVADEETVVIE